MHIIYSYNEILPKKRAHDVYIARNCAALAAAGAEVTLICGAGSLPPAALAAHYQLAPAACLQWKTLPIVRKNFGLPFTWNALFFWATQRHICRARPDWVALSVLKQGVYHLGRKVPRVRYVYEVHELAWYPGQDPQAPGVRRRLDAERRMLGQADAITVTTSALRDILQAPPYKLDVPVAVMPLAVDFAPLPPPPSLSGELHLMYVGQMYPGQGVDLLLRAIAHTEGVRLTLVGGKTDELAALQRLALELGIAQRVNFAGFTPPSELSSLVAEAHALVAPFSAAGRMPYVAHTKLLEYAAWQRPVVAPDLPVTREHFAPTGGWVPFIADDMASLVGAVQSLATEGKLQSLYASCRQQRVLSWSERSQLYLDFLRSL